MASVTTFAKIAMLSPFSNTMDVGVRITHLEPQQLDAIHNVQATLPIFVVEAIFMDTFS